MSSSQIKNLTGLGEVRVTKKRGLKRVSMRLHHSGQIRVSQPYYLPFTAGFSFAQKQVAWVQKQQQKEHKLVLSQGMAFGKGYKLQAVRADAIKSRVAQDQIIISLPPGIDLNSKDAQLAVKKAVKRALIKEAKEILPARVDQLAKQFGYSYSGLNIKPMKSRWGSCSSAKIVALNCYLMMLPWPIIDYVILHELAHTRHLNHGGDFWQDVHSTTPNYKQLKAQLKQLQPKIYALYV